MIPKFLQYGKYKIDIANKEYLRLMQDKYKDSGFFKDNGIFVNKWHELCVVISLDESEVDVSNQIDDTEKRNIIEDGMMFRKLEILNEFITGTMKCGELFTPTVTKLPNTYSYTIIYKPYYLVKNLSFYIYNAILYSSLVTITTLSLIKYVFT